MLIMARKLTQQRRRPITGRLYRVHIKWPTVRRAKASPQATPAKPTSQPVSVEQGSSPPHVLSVVTPMHAPSTLQQQLPPPPIVIPWIVEPVIQFTRYQLEYSERA